MKNILIISSSPRKKGNSQILCEQFKKGAEAKGHQVKIVRIMEQNIGFCRACDGCMRNGGTCVLKDDMAEILKMFQKADVLVLATPVYFYGISAQMKTFIDRTYPIWQWNRSSGVFIWAQNALRSEQLSRWCLWI